MDQPWVYIVLFGLVFIVYAKIMPKSAAEKDRQAAPSIHEIEETMEHFAAELEDQNRVLLEQLAGTKKEYEQQIAQLGAQVSKLEAEQGPIHQELAKLYTITEELQKQSLLHQTEMTTAPSAHSTSKITAGAVEHTQEEAVPPPAEAMNMKSRYAELFQLYDQGKSTDVIAKKLNMTKGEVSLIVQLAKQEDKLHAQ
ncbi:DUF6115 domain-containing protein [Paenibacillus sp. TAB 01]|uniref:DUF6115 domain-containing protein n=1 Tax=Paenibacillus sp. TAB 01 TaxID=3368988 RepID=UPI003753BA54